VSERSVVVRLEAEVSKFVRGQQQAQKATEETAKAQEALGKAVDDAAVKAATGSEKVAKGNRKQAQSSEEAAKSSKKSEDASKQDSKAKEQQAAAADTAGKSLTLFGATSIAALGASAKAAMDWESAWAGVTKTVDGSPEQMAELESQLRGLARTLPLSHQEIAGVAEAAGQLGVARKDVAGFTKTMIDLGETTNLTADEAATNIAQISNVMGTMEREGSAGVARFGAALVALGNDGASTEAEILSMAQRIAGAGATVGASETEVLALSNTLASMGVKAELGGGVTTRVLLKMYEAVQEGGDSLNAFAKVAGVSGAAFEKAFGESPVAAMDMVAQGLARIKGEGGNVVQSMKDVGIKGTEEYQVMLALAASGDLLTDSLELGSKAWKENTALLDEANKRYATTESKVKVAWNNIKDAAIEAGAVVLPMIAGLAETVSGLAQGFASLPQPVQGGITVLAGLTGGAALLAGGLLTVIPKIRDTKEALNVLAPAGSRANTVLSRTGRIAAGAATGIAAVGAAALAAQPALDGLYKPTGENADALKRFAGEAAQGKIGADTLGKSFEDLIQKQDGVSSFQQAINGIADPGIWGNIDNVLTDGIGILSLGMIDAASTSERARDRFKEFGQQLATLSPEKAAEAFQSMAAETDGSQTSLSRLLEYMPEYRRKLEEQAKASGKATDDQSLLNIAMHKGTPAADQAAKAQEVLKTSLDETGVGLDAVIEDMDKFLEQLFLSGQITMSARDANAAYNDALRGVPEALETIAKSQGKMGRTLNDAATDFDLTTEAGALANSAFQDIAQKGMAEVEAKAKEGLGQDELQEKLTTTYQDLVKNADQMGIQGQAAYDLAQKVLGIPDGVSIESWMSDRAKAMADQTKKSLDDIPKNVNITTTITEFRKAIDLGNGIGDGSYGQGLGVLAPKKAAGGDLDMAPGPKGQDSQLFWGAKGEHVLTASEVDLMGGQDAVYRFRSQLRAGNIPAHQNGGAVGSMGSVAAPASFGGGSSVSVSLELNVHGTTAPREVADEAVGMVKAELMKQGVKLGGR
jgi:TP901 family phage tail tape measure protein